MNEPRPTPYRGPPGAAGGYAYDDHTADVLIRAWGPSMVDAARQALLATAALSVPPCDVARVQSRTVLIEAPDPVAALVSAANELLFLLDVAGFVPADLHLEPLTSEQVAWRMTLDGDTLSGAAYQVGTIPKAATYHLASLAESPAGDGGGDAPVKQWQARLLLDL